MSSRYEAVEYPSDRGSHPGPRGYLSSLREAISPKAQRFTELS